MADLKVKLTFDDPSATSFTYDKTNGLKSFSLMTEAKSSAETLDYSVKSNAGSFSAKDIVAPEGEFYVNEFMNSFSELSTSDLFYYDTNIKCCCYDSKGGRFLFTGGTYRYEGDSAHEQYIYSTSSFSTSLPISKFYGLCDKILKFNDYIICAGVIANSSSEKPRYGIVVLDDSLTKTNIIINTTQTVEPYYEAEKYCYCLKEVNGKLFVSLGGYSASSRKNVYFDSMESEYKELDLYDNGQKVRLYDVIFNDNKYIFLTNKGIFTSKNLIDFTKEFSKSLMPPDYSASIIFHNNNYFVTGILNGILVGNNIQTLKEMHTNIKGVSKIIKLDNIYVLVSTRSDGSNNSMCIYYTQDFEHIYISDFIFNYNYFIDISLSENIIVLLSSYDYQGDSYIYKTEQKKEILKFAESLYGWLITKPEYENIYIDITLDGLTIGNFVNNGKIQYDNDEQEFSLDIQNPLTILQTKKYKRQFDKKATDVSAINFLLVLLVKCNQALGGALEFEVITQETQDYIRSIVIKYPYLEEDTLWNHLNKFCEMAQLVMYTNGTKIVIERWV